MTEEDYIAAHIDAEPAALRAYTDTRTCTASIRACVPTIYKDAYSPCSPI